MKAERDYENYDSLHVTVKKAKIDELIAHYAAFGWECIDYEEDGLYDDIIHLSLRRPHKIEHKDELQLMQVYLESALNKKGGAEANPCPKALAFGLTLGAVALTMIIVGLYYGFLTANKTLSVLCFVLAGVGGVVALLTAIFTVKICKREKQAARLAIEVADCEISVVCERAAALTSGTVKAAETGEARDER